VSPGAIQSEDWPTYEFVGDVVPDAKSIGVRTLGPCLVLVDEDARRLGSTVGRAAAR